MKNKAGYNFKATAKLRQTAETAKRFFSKNKKEAKENRAGKLSHMPQPAEIQITNGFRNQRKAAFSASPLLLVNSLTILYSRKVIAMSEIRIGILTTKLKSIPGITSMFRVG